MCVPKGIWSTNFIFSLTLFLLHYKDERMWLCVCVFANASRCGVYNCASTAASTSILDGRVLLRTVFLRRFKTSDILIGILNY